MRKTENISFKKFCEEQKLSDHEIVQAWEYLQFLRFRHLIPEMIEMSRKFTHATRLKR